MILENTRKYEILYECQNKFEIFHFVIKFDKRATVEYSIYANSNTICVAPSRNMDAPRPWEEDEMLDRSSSYRSSMGHSVGAIPSYNGEQISYIL